MPKNYISGWLVFLFIVDQLCYIRKLLTTAEMPNASSVDQNTSGNQESVSPISDNRAGGGRNDLDEFGAGSSRVCGTGLRRAARRMNGLAKALFRNLKKLFLTTAKPMHTRGNQKGQGRSNNNSFLKSGGHRPMVRDKGWGEIQGPYIAEIVPHSSQKPTLLIADSGDLSGPEVVPSLVESEPSGLSRTGSPCSLEMSKSTCLSTTGGKFTDDQSPQLHTRLRLKRSIGSAAFTVSHGVSLMTINASSYTATSIEEAVMNVHVDDGSDGELDLATRSLRFIVAGTVVDSLYGNHGFRTLHEAHALSSGPQGPLWSS